MKEKIDWKIVLGGIVCLTAVELYALSKGIDGIMLAAYAAIIAGVVGVVIPSSLIRSRKP